MKNILSFLIAMAIGAGSFAQDHTGLQLVVVNQLRDPLPRASVKVLDRDSSLLRI